MNRREFYTARSAEQLLQVLALVEKRAIESYAKEKLAKDEIMERLDGHPMQSITLADKLAQDGPEAAGKALERAVGEDVPGAKSESAEAVRKALERISTTVEETVRRLHEPLVKELNKLAGTVAGIDQNKAGKGEMNAALKTLGTTITEKLDSVAGDIQIRDEQLQKAMLTEQNVKQLIAERGVPKDAVRAAVMEAVEEKFDELRKAIDPSAAPAVMPGDGSTLAVKSEQALKDEALLAVAIANVRPIKMETAEKIFGVKLLDLSGKPINVEMWNDPDAEAINPDYVFDAEHLRVALFAMTKKPARNVFMFGETGTGKTEFARQLSARLGRRLYRVNFENQADSYNFIGGERAKNASTVYQYGTFTLGLKHPGAIILLDELCFGKPGHLAALHATLEYEGALTIQETGEKVRRAEGVIIFAADNTNGTGDRTGRYDGLYTMNGALRRRFSYWLQFDYPPAALEADIISRKTGVPIKGSKLVVDLMRACRAAARTGALADAPSLPHAIAFCELVQAGKPTRDAYEQSVVLGTSPEYSEKLQELYIASFKEQEFEKAL